MLEYIILAAILAWAVWIFYRTFIGRKGGCGCGQGTSHNNQASPCGGCPSAGRTGPGCGCAGK